MSSEWRPVQLTLASGEVLFGHMRRIPTPDFESQPRQADTQLQSPLGRLPAEIRIMIYEHVFTCEGEVNLKKVSALAQRRSAPRIALLLTCRMVLYEAESAFYRLNRLSIDQWNLKSFLDSLGSIRRHGVRRLCIYATNKMPLSRCGFADVQSLRKLPALESVHLMIPRGHTWIGCTPSQRADLLLNMERYMSRTEKLSEVKLLPSDRRLTAEARQRPLAESVDGKMVQHRKRWRRLKTSL